MKTNIIEYPGIKWDKDNIEIIQNSGLKLIHSVPFEEKEWWDNYYTPLENKIKLLKNKYKDNTEFTDYLDRTQIEIDLYRKYSEFYGYIYYVIQK